MGRVKTMKKKIFRGTATALVTPFRDKKIDYEALENIIETQILGGVGALVVGGTTGEAATLGEGERFALYEFARAKTLGRVPLILGVGTNDTEEVIRRTRAAEKIGCDAALVVTPYYNKGTIPGVTEHYLKVANCSDLPIMVYNVPNRTGVNLTLGQLEIFSKCEKIIGIKEATDSVDRFVKIAAFKDELPLYSGNDNSIYTALSLGGAGVISVLSNLMPKRVSDICRAYFEGDYEGSLSGQLEILPLVDAIFAETNPTPIKYAMSLFGLCSPEVRLPLAMPREETRELLCGLLHKE